MLNNVLYAVIAACALAFLVLLFGFTFWHLNLFWLAAWCYALADNILLLAFAVLILWVICLIMHTLFLDLNAYFRPENRVYRRIVTLQLYQREASQRLSIEKDQLQYLAQLKRQRLLAAHNKKHSHALFQAIQVELQDSIAPKAYKALLKDSKKLQKQADLKALLVLREKILCQASIG